MTRDFCDFFHRLRADSNSLGAVKLRRAGVFESLPSQFCAKIAERSRYKKKDCGIHRRDDRLSDVAVFSPPAVFCGRLLTL